jgi:Holliday junction resolvase RusA-like endonuclease
MSEFRCTIPGSPGNASVNGWRRATVVAGKPSTRPGAKYLAWRNLAVPLMRAAMRKRKPFARPCLVLIIAYWPKVYRIGAQAGLPFGDADAVIKAALDAMTHAGVYLDDALVTSVQAEKRHDADRPRVEVSVWEGEP